MSIYARLLCGIRDRGRRLQVLADEAGQDLLFAIRQFVRAPGFTVTVTLMLALGIGANTAIFSLVHHLILAPLPFADGDRMVMLSATSNGGLLHIGSTADLANAWSARARTIEQIVILRTGRYSLGDTAQGATQSLDGAAIPPGAIAFVGLEPILGRAILPSDTVYDAPPVAMLGEGVWRRTFGASRDVLGKSIVLNGQAHTVIGVMPNQFYIPFTLTGARQVLVASRSGGVSGSSDVTGLAKLRRGVTIDEANRELASILPPKSDVNPSDDPPRLMRGIDMANDDQKDVALLLFGAVGFVLLIACANVANLLLARSWSRQREFAIRAALGAGRARIMRQVVTESLMLALIGGTLGIAVSFLVLRGVRAGPPAGARMIEGVQIERAVLLWSLGLSVSTGLLFGIAPAQSAVGGRVGEALKAGARTSAGSAAGRRLRFGLVIVEVALSVMLLAGAGLLVRTLVALNQVDVGFRSTGLVGVPIRLTAKRFSDLAVRRAAIASALDGVRAIPGVRGAINAFMSPPNFGLALGAIEIEGRSNVPGDTLKVAGVNGVPPEFFAFVGLPIDRGRTFTPATGLSDRLGIDEIIINESMARRLWPNGDALGARIRRGSSGPATVIGVVRDIRLPAAQDPNKELQLYLRGATAPTNGVLVVRSDLPLARLGPAVARAVHDADPSIKVGELTTSDAVIAASMTAQRLVLMLLGAFAALAVVLAAAGLHGVIAYAVGQRTREIGVRMALGAQAEDVARLVLGQGLALAAAGVVVGVTGALAATRVLRSLLYNVRPEDPITLGAVGALLLLIAVAASYAPARRAARLDPVEALRAD